MFRFVALLATIAAVSAFAPAASRVSSKSALRMNFAESLPGASGPFGFFDPLGLSADKDEATIRRWRESELKHGRVAMLGALGIIVGEAVEEENTPLFNDKLSGPAIYQFQEADALTGFGFAFAILGLITVIETFNIRYAWETDEEKTARDPNGKTNAQLKPDYINGNLGFDPLGLKPADEEAYNTMATKELNNGRLAMIGAAGMIVQELVSGKGIAEFLGLEAPLPAAFDTNPF